MKYKEPLRKNHSGSLAYVWFSYSRIPYPTACNKPFGIEFIADNSAVYR